MNADRFDSLARSLTAPGSRRRASGLSRRATLAELAALAGGVCGAGFLALMDDAEARKKQKRKKKKKKRCTGGTKKCAKQCVPATDCCSSADCGNGATCVNGTCNPGPDVLQCPSGFKNCAGDCIAAGQCCGACPGDKVCDAGVCACPANAPFVCPGDVCFSESGCCVTENCSGGFECVEGLCLCSGAVAINCNAICCDGNTEVCKLEVIGDDVVPSCAPGSCPPTDFCTDSETEQFVCANDLERVCVCTSTTDLIPGRVCVDLNLLVVNNPCKECDASSECGTGQVCIAGGDGCVCDSNFCVPLCPEAP